MTTAPLTPPPGRRKLGRRGLGRGGRGRASLLKPATVAILAMLALAYAAIGLFADLDLTFIARHPYFVLIGLAGASVANSTGVGGGVVFVPAFRLLEQSGALTLDAAGIVGTSFVIQCFGMTVGALTWLNRIYQTAPPDTGVDERGFWRIVLIVMACCAPTLWATQAAARPDPLFLFLAFKSFSIVLGLTLLATTWTIHFDAPERRALEPVDFWALGVIGAAGGVATALFSVGVGELLALYLFIRHFPMNTSVGTAVACSALTVILGAPYTIIAHDLAWEVVALAAPGVVAGGFLARRIAHFLGVRLLKTFAALWIIGSSAALILAGG